MKPTTMQPTSSVGQFLAAQAGDCLINPVSMTPEEFTRQHGPQHGQVTICHPKTVWPPERPPLTLWQRLLPWTRPKLTDAEKLARKQLD
jgi:hypothetical protein